MKGPEQQRSASPGLLRRLFQLGWRYRQACLVVVALQALIVAIHVAGLRLAGLGIDVVRYRVDPASRPPHWPLGIEPPASWPAMGQLAAIAAALLIVAAGLAAVKFAAALAAAALSQRVLLRLRTDVYDKLQRLSFQFFDTAETSSLINRAAGDVQAVRTFVDGVIVRVLSVVLSLAVYLAYMLSVHVPLTIACVLTSPLLYLGAVLFSRIVRPEYRRSSELGDHLITTLSENIQGVHVVKGFAREEREIAVFRAANSRYRDQKQRIFWQVSTFQPLMGFLTQINMLVLIGFGGYLVIRGHMPLGAGLFVFANLLHEFANQVGHITNIANTVQSSLMGAERVFEVLDTPVDIQSPPNPRALPRAVGDVVLRDVAFAYRPDEPVLRNVSLHVRPGECLGLVGETGAGKSTLLSLLPRFYDVRQGSVSLDGHDVRSLDLDQLRRNIGIVFQESFLFSNTVAANIAFGHPDASREAIERAARIAAAHQFISELPQGYDTVIGEHGSNLSGGQRQRLAIARALLLDPPVLLLDDATASVDAHTEHEIQQAMESAMRGRTTLLISNRVSTLRRADRIAVLHKGSLIQCGTHEDLLGQPGYYRRLAELQFADLSNEPAEPAA
ncbi:MAG: ABC transporter ATP-binding protein [Pirellulaceae bacterium]|nr:ABC transporter ATP-binding protein [Pirellulaceae bacterium]